MKSIVEFIQKVVGLKSGKIAILTPLFTKFSGAGRVAEQQAIDLAKNGYDVKVITMGADINVPENIKIEIIRIPKFFILNRIYRTLFFCDVFRSIKWVRKLKGFDVVIAHLYPMTFLATLAKSLFKVKYIYCNHEIGSHEAYYTHKIEKLYNKINNIIGKLFIKNADYVISDSRFSRNLLLNALGRDSIVIHPKPRYRPNQKNLGNINIKEKYGISESPVILFVGRIVQHKGVHILIKAFNKIKAKMPDAKLLIVGNPYYSRYFYELRKISDSSIIFAGYVPDEELPSYYLACDVYATCSLFEGFNLPVLEAQIFGKPVVAFDIGPHREILKIGYLVKQGDIEEFSNKLLELVQRVCSEIKWRRKYENIIRSLGAR